MILPMVRCVWRVTICGAASWCTHSCRLPLGRVIRQPAWGEGAPFTHNKKKATESEEPGLKPPPLKGGLLWKVWEVGWGANGSNYSLPQNRPAAILTTATSQRHRALLIDNDQPSSVSTSSSVVLPHNHECELP